MELHRREFGALVQERNACRFGFHSLRSPRKAQLSEPQERLGRTRKSQPGKSSAAQHPFGSHRCASTTISTASELTL
jgi:hypothetical protein